MSLEQYIKAIEESNIVSKTNTDGIITFVNDEFCKISEFTRKELLHKNHNIVRHPSMSKEYFEILWTKIENKKTFKGTMKNLSKSGKTLYLNTTITPILDEKNNILEYIAIRYDMTKEISSKEYKNKLEEQLAKQTKELYLLNRTLEDRVKNEIQKNEEKQKIIFMQSRFASLGQMIANIAHQWRQPLTELNLALFSLKKSALQNNHNDINTFYKKSKEVTKEMSQIIELFSNFFNPNKETTRFYISIAINDALRILSNDISSQEIQIHINIEEIRVKGICNELTQVIINLILNAKDAFVLNSIQKREINIRVSKSFLGSKVFALIIIEDNAGGIIKEDLDKVFEPYFSTKHASVGTGIGLFISNLIIQKSLHGTIEAINANGGAKFTITIPLIKENY